MAKGLTRPITRKQALSYQRLRPNGLGVTALAAINGRKKKRKAAAPKKNYRYTAAGARDELRHLKGERRFSPRELASIRRDGRVARGGQKYYSPYLVGFARQKAKAKKRAAPPRARANRHSPEYERRYRKTRSFLGAPVRNRSRIAGMPVVSIGDEGSPYAMQRYPLVHVPKSTRRRRARRAPTEEKVMKRKRKSTKRSLAAKKAARTRAKKHAARVSAGRKAARTRKRRRAHGAAPKHRRKAARRPARRRTAKGRYRRNDGAAVAAPVVAKANRKRRKARKTTKRSYRPITARVGGSKIRTYMYKTKKGVKHIPLYALAGGRSAAAFRAATSPGHKKAHTKTAAAVRKRVAAIMRARGRGVSRRVASIFTPNRGVIPFAAWSKSMKPNRRRKKAAKKSVRRSRRASPRRRRKTVHATRKRRRTSRRRKVAAAPRRRRRRRKAAAAPRKRRRTHRRKAAAPRKRRRYAKNARRRHARRRHAAGTTHRRRRYGKNRRRRSSYLPVRVARIGYRSNKRRHHRRHYARNRAHAAHGFRAGDFMSQFVSALKVGLAVAGGIVLHRSISTMLSKQLATQPSFQSGALATYRDAISQIVVAAAAMFGLSKVGESVRKPWVTQANAGVFGSLAHGLLSMLVAKMAPQYSSMLAGYADNSSRAYSGFGEYMSTSGFGNPMLSQAAAGFGNPMLSQAAAGYGEYVSTSGFGNPMLSQAAAGTGEYVASGVQGIGDYEMVNGTGSFGVDEDGIKPNLTSAEHALNIAEAAAGVAIGDLPPQSTQWPMMVAKPIGDTMTGARAGTFQGRDGIFG